MRGKSGPSLVFLMGTYSQIKGSTSKIPCKVATTANITLSNTQTIDGVSVVSGDRVLVWNQSTPADNGIYVDQDRVKELITCYQQYSTEVKKRLTRNLRECSNILVDDIFLVYGRYMSIILFSSNHSCVKFICL